MWPVALDNLVSGTFFTLRPLLSVFLLQHPALCSLSPPSDSSYLRALGPVFAFQFIYCFLSLLFLLLLLSCFFFLLFFFGTRSHYVALVGLVLTM